MANSHSVSIGKDVLESLTTSMYEDSRYIYREYIQNAADQLDKAIKAGIIDSEDAEIYISIDSEKQTIIIKDYATGISETEVLPILRNIAKSTKIKGKDKGFRGIGRLGGLGYCDKLIFETTFKGEGTKSILTWDAEQLRNIINDRSTKEEAVEVIEKVTELTVEPTDIDDHFFQITMVGVFEEKLLDLKEVRRYLSMVAPVPYANHFILRDKIYEELKREDIKLDEYKIFINSEQLYKAYSMNISDGEEGAMKVTDSLFDLNFFKEYDTNDNLLYWGWYGLSSSPNKILNPINTARGIRLRKENIQVGDEYTLVKLHKQERTNFYFFGEVHAISSELIPNSRRDYFSVSKTVTDFEKKLQSYFQSGLYKLSYEVSKVNSLIKKVDELENYRKEFEKKEKSGGFTDARERKGFIEKFEAKKHSAELAHQKLSKIQNELANADITTPTDKVLNKVLSSKKIKPSNRALLVAETKPKYRIASLNTLSKEQKSLLSKVFSIIRDVLDNSKSEELIKRIEEELK